MKLNKLNLNKLNLTKINFKKINLNKILKNLKYPLYVVLMVCFILGILVILQSVFIRNDANNTDVKVTVVETFKSSCDKSKSLKERNEWCKNLNEAPCKYNDCCVLLNNTENGMVCAGGGASGPTFEDTDYEYYVHKKRCYSSKTKTEIKCP